MKIKIKHFDSVKIKNIHTPSITLLTGMIKVTLQDMPDKILFANAVLVMIEECFIKTEDKLITMKALSLPG